MSTFSSAPPLTVTEPIVYAPYRAGYFFRLREPEVPVHEAATLLLDQGKAYATPTTWKAAANALS